MTGRWKTLLTVFAAVLTIQALFLYSPYFTYDSFEYLQLSLFPKIGAAHSFGFGMILRLYYALAKMMRDPGAVLKLYMIHQSLLLSAVFLIPVECARRWLARARERSWLQLAPGALLQGAFWLLLAPGLLMLSSAVWSEITYFFLMLLCFWLVLKSTLETPWKWGAACALVVFGYHVRYQFVIVPGALLVSSVVDWLRSRRRDRLRNAVLAVLMLASIKVADFGLRDLFGSSPVAAAMMVRGAAASMQCALRCDFPLFSRLKCVDPERTGFVNRMFCSDLTLGFVPAGDILYEGRSLGGLMSFIGAMNTLKWLIRAPFVYFLDEHTRWGLEVGRYEFLKDSSRIMFPEAVAFYEKGMQIENAQPRGLFRNLLVLLNFLHFRLKLYHCLLALTALLSIPLALGTRDAIQRVLALSTLMTLAIFAYFNAEVPIRFLIQTILPGLLGCLLFAAERLDAQS